VLTTPLRADARRNQELIVAAARTLFQERGVDIPMDEIARAAGVGVGTLYRRFPDREALLLAVTVDTIRRLAELAKAAWDDEPDAWSALTKFVRGCAEFRLDALQAATTPQLEARVLADPELAAAQTCWTEHVEMMVSGAQRDGTMRADVSSGELIAIISMLICHPPAMPAPLVDVVRARFLEVTLDGLRRQ
jgi:AcrR family transcriptional regulator